MVLYPAETAMQFQSTKIPSDEAAGSSTHVLPTEVASASTLVPLRTSLMSWFIFPMFPF